MWKAPRSASIQIYAVLLCWLASEAQCQVLSPYAPLPSGPYENSPDGTFIWPSGDTAIFDEGSTMTIRWTTSYPSVNLYNIYQQNISIYAPVPHEMQIVTGFTGTSTDWVITCNPNCLRPFSFRAVNATGTQQELLDGGFWSRLYWIRPSASPSSTSSTSTQSSTSTSSSSQSTSTKSSTTASGTSSTTNSSKGGSNSGNSSKDTAIGVGVGVGVGVALLLIGGFFLWRRYHRKLKARYSRPPTVTGSEIEAWPQPSWSYQGGELPAANAPKELSGQPQGPNFHELPSQEHS